MGAGRFTVGIDLGTTHTAMAYVDGADTASFPRIHTFEIPQLVKPGVIERKALLPSCIYLPGESEFADDGLVLPWSERTPRTEKGVPYTVGEFARVCGLARPGRFVSSAKSWLSQPGSKRRKAMLPWNADPGVSRLSPVEASSLILQHLVSAWNFEMRGDRRNGLLSEQKIVLCVPASFDASARDLTMEAAKRAGLVDVTLLEEPQAAFYAWIAQAGHNWRSRLTVGDLALIVDVGGGTTDFSLIAVEEERGAVALRRIAVGEHILLGGDNMDLALARSAATRLHAEGTRLDAWQLRGLALACKEAKERLLEMPPPAVKTEPPPGGSEPESDVAIPELSVPFRRELKSNIPPDSSASYYIRRRPKKSVRKTGKHGKVSAVLELAEVKPAAPPQLSMPILGRGAAVVGSSVNASLALAEAERVILDGFLDLCEPSARPSVAARSGLREMGLDYAADPSITKHLAKFLAGDGSKKLHPTAILFNGGVMKSGLLRERTAGIVSAWIEREGGGTPRELSGSDPELAVARGAAFFGRVDAARGVRISGGVPRSYYVGVEAARLAVPGQPATIGGLCVVPFGMEEGTELDVPDAEFGLVVGERAQFRFFSAAERHEDRIGERVEIRQDSIRELEPMEATIPVSLFDEAGTVIPVRLKSVVTTMGTLELWFHASDGAGAWKLELNVRE